MVDSTTITSRNETKHRFIGLAKVPESLYASVYMLPGFFYEFVGTKVQFILPSQFVAFQACFHAYFKKSLNSQPIKMNLANSF